jgi:hypothetical protein
MELMCIGYGTYPLPDNIQNDIPALAWTVPDLEAFARVELRSVDGGELRACIQSTIVNGLTAEQTSVKWAAGMFTLVAILVGLIHSCINSPSPAQYRWFDVVLLYQTAVALVLMPLNYPLVYRAFARNFFWAVGMVSSESFRTSINNMRYKTGGHLNGTAFPDVQFINADLSDSEGIDVNQLIDTIRQLGPLLGSGGLGGLLGRSLPDVPEEDLYLLQTLESLHTARPDPATHLLTARAIPDLVNEIRLANTGSGIPAYVNSLGIPRANAFTTLFFIMLIVVAIAIALHAIIFVIAYLVERSASRQNWGGRLIDRYWGWCGGNALRLVCRFRFPHEFRFLTVQCLLFFLPVWIFGFYQFVMGDSKLAIFFAAFSLALTIIPLLVVLVISIIRSRRTSSTAPDISQLYTSYRMFHSAGALYRQYRQRFHFFWFIIVLALIARAGFISFANGNAWASVIGNIVVEAIIFVALIACRPHKDRKGDWLAPILSFFRLACFGLCIAFVPSMDVEPIPRAICAFVMIAGIGLPTVLLFFGLIFNAFYGYLWRRHTHRIEDGLEVERFVASDDESQKPPMMSQRYSNHHNNNVDANNFVSGAGAMESRSTSGNSLGRRTSVIEPVGNTYEPSVTSPRSSRLGHGGQEYNAYNAAGSGGHEFDGSSPYPSRPGSGAGAFERRQTRGRGSGYYQ